MLESNAHDDVPGNDVSNEVQSEDVQSESSEEIQPESVVCYRCNAVYHRPPSLTVSTFAECDFVCENCRCKDCSIVLGFECECGDKHAEPSQEDSRLCSECHSIRTKVSNLDAELLRMRDNEVYCQDSIYSGVTDCKSKPIPIGE